MNEWGREVNFSCGTSGKARWRIQSEQQIICCGSWPWTLDLVFHIESQMLSSDYFSGHAENLPWMQQFFWFSWKCSTGFFSWLCTECRSFLTKLNLPVSVPVGGRKENTKQLESFLFRWTSGLKGFIANLQGLSSFIFPLSLPLFPLCLYPLSPVFFSLSALLYQRHCFYCALKRSHKLTCWILNWDIKPQGSRMQRKLFYILSLWKLFMFIIRCTRWISTQKTSIHLLKSGARL